MLLKIELENFFSIKMRPEIKHPQGNQFLLQDGS